MFTPIKKSRESETSQPGAVREARRMLVLGAFAVSLGMLALPAAGEELPPMPQSAICALADRTSDALVHLPFETVDGRIYVPVQVNGKGPFRFAVDTGASGLARADTSLTRVLGLKSDGHSSTSDGVAEAAVETTRLSSIQLGQLVKTNLDAITRDYASRSSEEARFSGILAREFFADGLLVIDFPRKMLTFSRTQALPKQGQGILSYEKAFRVPVSIGEIDAIGNLDTGANVSLVVPRALYERIEAGPLEQAGRAQLTNGQLDLQRTTVSGPFRLGALSATDVEVRVSDKYPELLVGSHVLQKAVVLIDQRSKTIAICE
jgi:predicted aspartyl protease